MAMASSDDTKPQPQTEPESPGGGSGNSITRVGTGEVGDPPPSRFIWYAGNMLGLNETLFSVLRIQRGSTAVRAGADGMRLRWRRWEFTLRQDNKLGMVIIKPDEQNNVERWNSALQDFYDEVVRPAADRTGGVAAGISAPEEDPE